MSDHFLRVYACGCFPTGSGTEVDPLRIHFCPAHLDVRPGQPSHTLLAPGRTMFLVPEVKFAAPVLLCQCDHDSSQHYNQHGRCGGDDDNCGCVLWDPFSAALAAARGSRP